MKVNVSIVTSPLPQASQAPLSNLVKLFSMVAYRVYVVSGGAAEYFKFDANVEPIIVPYKVSSNILLKILKYMHTQLKILFHLFVISRKANLFFFFLGGEYLFVPMLILKLLRKKVILMLGGITTRVHSVKKDSLSKFVSMLASLNFSLADRLIIYSHRLIQEGNFARYQHKILVAHRHFVDFTRFAIRKKIDQRANVVGYIGRLSEEKGTLELIMAIPPVLNERKDVRFILCGEGDLSNKIKNTVKDEGLEAYVKLTGWISHEDVPLYLNEIRLFVLPSFTEGLPNILLEAMACGTPVLAAQVGAIPSVVVEGITGFLLRSTRPEYIAKRILELLDDSSLLERVSNEAHSFVSKQFCFEKTLESWRKIIRELIHTN